MKPEVLDAMLPYFREQFGNPSSVHWAGRMVSGAIEKAREQVANLLNCSAAEVIFLSCGSEGDNYAIKGTAEALKHKGNHIITTSVEHPAVLETCEALEKDGFDVTYLGVDQNGMLDLNELEAAITDKTILISVMWPIMKPAIFTRSRRSALLRKNTRSGFIPMPSRLQGNSDRCPRGQC